MKHIVYSWELGADLGHILRFLPLAKVFQERGYKITLILRDLTRAQEYLGQYNFELLQAPVWNSPVHSAPRPMVSYAEILQHHGFFESTDLLRTVRAWRSLFKQLKPDLMLFDHAPTALLASRGLLCSKASIDDGFSLPPQQEPLPAFVTENPPSTDRIVNSEKIALKAANRVLKTFGQPEMKTLRSLWEIDERFLCTLPSLDHYPTRTGETYWGLIPNELEGVDPRWPPNGKLKIFAYFKPPFCRFVTTVSVLAKTGCSVLKFAPQVTELIVKRYQSDHLKISPSPFCIDTVVDQSDLVLCHSGSGTVSKAIVYGKPLFLAPTNREQVMIAQKMANVEASLTLNDKDSSSTIQNKLNYLLENKSFARAAQQCAQRIKNEQPDNALKNVFDRCQQLLN